MYTTMVYMHAVSLQVTTDKDVALFIISSTKICPDLGPILSSPHCGYGKLCFLLNAMYIGILVAPL